MSKNGYPEDVLTAHDAINHNVRLLQSLLPPWPEHFNTFKEAKQWVLVQCVTGRVRFARFQNKTHNQMRGNVIYRTTKHAEDAKLFALLKTEEGAITGPDVDRTTRSNAQNLVILRDGKSIGNKTWDRYEEPRERVRQGNTVHDLIHKKALEAQRDLDFPRENVWPPTFNSEEAAQAWIEEKLKSINFIYGKCPRGGRGHKWWCEEVRRRIILNARNAGFYSITPPGRDEVTTVTVEDFEDSDSSGGIPISFHALEPVEDDKTESNTVQDFNRDDALGGYPLTTRCDSIYNDSNFPLLPQTMDPETLSGKIPARSQKSNSD